METIRPIAHAHQDNVDALREFRIVLLTMGGIDGEGLIVAFVGLPSVALRYHLDALNVFQKLEGKQPDVGLWLLQTAYMDGVVSTDYLQSGNAKEAIRYSREAVQVLSRVDKTDATTGSLLTSQKGAALSHMGDALLFGGRWSESVSEYRSELSLFKELLDPKDIGSLESVADACLNLGHAESLAGKPTAGWPGIVGGFAGFGASYIHEEGLWQSMSPGITLTSPHSSVALSLSAPQFE